MGLRTQSPANPLEVEPPELGQAHRCGCTQGGSFPSVCVYIYLDKQKTSVLEPSAATLQQHSSYSKKRSAGNGAVVSKVT